MSKPTKKRSSPRKATKEESHSTAGLTSAPVNVPSTRTADQPEYNLVRQEAALVKLGVDREELRKAPPLTEMLKNANGGLETVVEAMRFSEDPSIEAFLTIYDKSSDLDHRVIPWEAYALVAEVDMAQLLGAIMLAIRQYSVKMTSVIAMTHHPETIRTRVMQAKKPEGYRDRDALDRALGFTPVPKGATFNFNIGDRGNDQESDRGAEGSEIDVDYLFPSLSETQRQLNPPKDDE